MPSCESSAKKLQSFYRRGCLKKTMERALPLELSEEGKRAWQTTRRAFECFLVASCDSFSTVYRFIAPYLKKPLICPHPLHHERPSTRRLHPYRPGEEHFEGCR